MANLDSHELHILQLDWSKSPAVFCHLSLSLTLPDNISVSVSVSLSFNFPRVISLLPLEVALILSQIFYDSLSI